MPMLTSCETDAVACRLCSMLPHGDHEAQCPVQDVWKSELHHAKSTALSQLSWPRSADLRRRFAGKPWLDVFSKADLLEEEFDAADDLLAAGLCSASATASADSRHAASGRHADKQGSACASSGHPVSHRLQQAAQLDAATGSSTSAATVESAEHDRGADGAAPQVDTAIEAAAALPRAVRASSVTGEGLDPLKVNYCGFGLIPASHVAGTGRASISLPALVRWSLWRPYLMTTRFRTLRVLRIWL